MTLSLAPGGRIGPYEVSSALGAGSMGAVYRAHDVKLNRDVALKVLLLEVADNPEDLLARLHLRARQRRSREVERANPSL